MTIEEFVIAANNLGRPYGVRVVYQFDRYTRLWKYNFYRGRVWIGGTSLKENLAPMMRKFTSCEQINYDPTNQNNA